MIPTRLNHRTADRMFARFVHSPEGIVCVYYSLNKLVPVNVFLNTGITQCNAHKVWRNPSQAELVAIFGRLLGVSKLPNNIFPKGITSVTRNCTPFVFTRVWEGRQVVSSSMMLGSLPQLYASYFISAPDWVVKGRFRLDNNRAVNQVSYVPQVYTEQIL